MSIGRHARKRAAQAAEKTAVAENQLINDQQELLKKEDAKKAAMEKDIEGQRIATMRARFGGQVPQQSTSGAASTQNTATAAGAGGGKNRTPNTLMTNKGTSSNDPMRQTILSMMLGNDDGVM